VTDLRKLGRDAEADLTQVLAAASLRDGMPVYGLFGSLYLKPMVDYVLAEGQAMGELLDAQGRQALQNTIAGKWNGADEALSADQHRHGYGTFAVPVNLVVPYHPFLVSDIDQAWDSLLDPSGVDHGAMKRESARLQLEHLEAQARATEARSWFERA